MQARSYPRASEIDCPSLADAIRSHMVAACGNDSFYVSWTGNHVVIEPADLSRVNDATVQAAVNAAPVPSNKLNVKRWVDEMPPELKVFALVVLDEINVLRSKVVPALAARTPAQLLAAMRAKADETVMNGMTKG